MSDDTRAVIARWIELFNGGALDEMEGMLASDFVDHGAFPGQPEGPAGFMWKMRLVAAGLSDARFRLERQCADGDWIANHYTVTGKHTGDLFGIAATGNDVSFEAMDFIRVADGKLAENHALSDSTTLMAQLGVA